MKNGKQRQALSRRTFLKGSAWGLSAIALAACAPVGAPAGGAATEGEAAAGEVTELRLSAWADVQDAVVYENIVKAYQAKNPNVKVAVEQYPGGYYEKVQANFAADDAADVLYMQG